MCSAFLGVSRHRVDNFSDAVGTRQGERRGLANITLVPPTLFYHMVLSGTGFSWISVVIP